MPICIEYCGEVSYPYPQYFLRYELISSDRRQTDRRQTENDTYEPTKLKHRWAQKPNCQINHCKFDRLSKGSISVYLLLVDNAVDCRYVTNERHIIISKLLENLKLF